MRSRTLFIAGHYPWALPSSRISIRTLFQSPNAAKNGAEGEKSYNRPAETVNRDVSKEEEYDYDQKIDTEARRQFRAPWNREGSDRPPAARSKGDNVMEVGRMLTTPSRMLKLILPLARRGPHHDRERIEPLALLVHPQQPLSYLERLIQAELPLIKDEDTRRPPSVYFRAENLSDEAIEPGKASRGEGEEPIVQQGEGRRESAVDASRGNEGGKDVSGPSEGENTIGGQPVEAEAQSHSGIDQARDGEDPKGDENFVRWSSSTELGDFIRDAAKAKRFAVEIEGAPEQIMVAVPSFEDRTYYLRMRLRKKSREIGQMAGLKRECDELAHRGAKRMARAGFGVLVLYWYMVYRLTFETDLGWDFMEPITYLVGLSTLMGGYGWFLYHNREVSYRSAMNLTISRRQSKLYDQKGFDVNKWQMLIEEGNSLRREIKAVATEYDVDWNESADEQDERVTQALKKGAKKEKRKKREEEEGKDQEDRD